MKRADKYFTKGLQAGVLATALIAGTTSCSQPSGGNDGYEMENPNGGYIPNPGTETGWKQPAYMNVTEEFGGQRFVEADADWFYDDQNDKDNKFTEHYADANKYIAGQVADLKQLWQDKNTDSTLSDLSEQIANALENFNDGESISEKIYNNYDALVPVFATMEETFYSDPQKFHTFNASYHKLAAYAYNQSLGAYKNEIGFTTNREMETKEGHFFDELADAGLEYNDFTVENAKTLMNGYLSTIADNTNTDQALLKKVVELALVNESLYGLNDFARRTNVSNQDFANNRSLNYFTGKINEKIDTDMKTTNYTQDDRTM